MPSRLLALVIVTGFILTIVGTEMVFTLPSRATPEETIPPSYQASDQLPAGSTIAWIPYWDQERAEQSLRQHAEQIDFIGVFWYALLRDGTIGRYPYAKVDPSLVRYAQEQDIQVLAVLANLPTEDEGGDWDSDRVDLVISTAERRRRHIDDIVTLAQTGGFDGINIDYEALKEKQRNNFTIFIAELADALHANGKILGISLHPKPAEGNPSFSNGSQAQDFAALADAADQLYLMTYEQHYKSSSPGPIASIEWIGPLIDFARRRIPQAKLFAGMPLYGYDWAADGSADGLTYTDVRARQTQYQASPQWDDRSGNWHFAYTDENGVEHEVWYEDAKTVAAKRTIIEKMLIPNIALWRIGGEDQAVWSQLP